MICDEINIKRKYKLQNVLYSKIMEVLQKMHEFIFIEIRFTEAKNLEMLLVLQQLGAVE